MKNDIIVSWGNCSLFACFFVFFFLSLHLRAFCPEKNRDPFLQFIVFPLSQLQKVQYIYLYWYIYIYVFISVFIGPTARHPQHIDDKGRGPERGGGRWVGGGGVTNIVPEEEKRGNNEEKTRVYRRRKKTPGK